MLVLWLFVLQSATALAAPATTATVEKLLTVTRAEQLMKSMQDQFDQLGAQIAANLPGKPDEKRAKDFRAELKKATEEFKEKYLNFKDFKADLIKVYQESWAESELQELVKFYETPVGKKAVQLLPGMMQKTAGMVQAKVQSHSPELDTKIKALVKKHYPELMKQEK